MQWIAEHGLELLSLVLIAAGVWWLMPRVRPWPRIVGLTLALTGTVLGVVLLDSASDRPLESILFSLFATAAIFCAILMITNRNPVYSALWFAMVTLNVCGLFLLQLAPFLAAATVIVYAGAIVVTFVFVIMLAQQSGATEYDQRSRQPVIGTLAAFALFAMVTGTLQLSRADRAASTAANISAADTAANPLSRLDSTESLGTMRGLGRSLFGDYLFAVELAGTLLLVATIGAIAIAPRRSRGTL
jgi:NADH-quinone oxidoreductase subunit J